MRCLVTGAAGFIGSHLCARLAKDGYDVVALDNLSTGSLANLPKHEKIKFIRMDLGNKQAWAKRHHFIKDIDIVFHLGAFARIQPSILHPERAFNDNLWGTFLLLQHMRHIGCNNIVYSSTSSSYGRKNPTPTKEDMHPDCLTPYAATKVGAEMMVKAWGESYDIQNITLKYFNVYGPRSPESGAYAPVIGLFFRQALRDKTHLTIVGDGTQRRDMTHVDDVVEANIKAMNKLLIGRYDDLSRETFNIGCGQNYSINETAKMVLDSLHAEDLALDISTVNIPPRPAEASETLANIEKAKTYLNWEPKISLQEGIERIKPYYVEKYGHRLKKDKLYQRRGNISHLFS
jgi:UDP-glucose 4-epimerase